MGLPNPTLFGRTMMDGNLVPLLMEQSLRPPEVADSCYCRCLRKCTRIIAGVKCAVGCKCGGKPEKRVRTVMDSDGDSD